jgi:hypothetical protein
MLLWPAVAFHAAATILLGRSWLGDRGEKTDNS